MTQREPQRTPAFWLILALGLILGLVVFFLPNSGGRIAVGAIAMVSALIGVFMIVKKSG